MNETKNPQHLDKDKMIPDSAEPRLESFYTPFVALSIYHIKM